jgi:hypothetical protein
MKDELYINGQTFCAVRVAVNHVSYSKDYITRLAREQKIRAVHIGRNWYVDIDVLKRYVEVQTLETSVRNRHLQQQRKTEHELRGAIVARAVNLAYDQGRLVVYSMASVCLVILLGLALGAGVGQLDMLAAVPAANQPAVTESVSPDEVALVPNFTAPQASVAVTPDREIIRPVTEKDWLRIRYD